MIYSVLFICRWCNGSMRLSKSLGQSSNLWRHVRGLYIGPPPDTISRGTQGIFPSSAGWAAHSMTL